MRHYDLCVIGSGPAGQKCAIQAAKLGKHVCVVEKSPVVGGAAVHTGTIPSKALREAILNLGGRRVGGGAMPRIRDFVAGRDATFRDLLSECQKVIRAEIDLVRGHFASNGIDLKFGTASFRDAGSVDVRGEHSMESLSADFFLIAVGTQPAKPPGMPFDQQDVITSDELLVLDHMPRSMIVVGGGVIGTEYASMLAALGVRVTLVEGRSRVLDFVDSEICEALQYHLRQNDVTLRLGEKVVRVERQKSERAARVGNEYLAVATLESGKTITADCLLYAIGRQGATEALNLSAAGLEADDRGRILVDAGFRTKVPHIFAAGDVIGFPALASTSLEQGRLAACGMFGERCEKVDDLLPYGIYSIPEISMVGWTEERLTKENIPYEAGIAQYKETARGQLLGDEIGMLKLLIHQESHQILGVHAIGTGATELIHIGQTAMAFRATVEYFVNTVFNYPTLAECYKVAALNGLNKLRHA